MSAALRLLLRSALALCVAVALVLGWALWPERAGFDAVPLLAEAARYDARIVRDEFGIPHVYGRRDADVAYGLAWVQCEDDFETLQQVLLATRGQLAAHEGRDAAPTDFLAALLGFWDDVEARYESDLSPAARAVAEGFAAGVNHWAARHRERVAPGVVPVRGHDLVAGFAFKTPLFYGLQKHVQALFAGPDQLALDGAQALHWRAASPPPLGSNAFAVAPSRSSDGATRLLVNSHQPFTGPVAWYEVRLASEEGWEMAGGVFPGSPVVLHGHNRHLGWANTVNQPDLVDVYRLEIHPDDPDLYRLDGAWRRLERTEVPIRVRLLGRLRWTVTREILRSEHGPALRLPHGTFALRFAGQDEIRQLEQYYRLNRATDLASWLDAMRLQALPSINYVYADREGNIGYFYNALLPDRKPGVDWRGTLPGDRSEWIWRRTLPFDALPQVVNPPSGFVVNANHSPFHATRGPGNPDPAAFGPELGIDDPMTNRALRALALLGADEAVSREDFHACKYDKRYDDGSDVVALWRELLALDVGDDPRLVEAQRLLATWQRTAEADDRVAALALLSLEPVIRARREREAVVPELRETFAEAVAVLDTHFGRLDPPWREVNRLRRGAVDLPVAGGPDLLRAIYGELAEDGRLVARAGDTLVMFVEWGADGTLRSEAVHQFGSATLDERSPHHADQAPLYVREQTRPVWLDEAAVRSRASRVYRPGE